MRSGTKAFMTKQQSASKVKQAKRKWDFKIIEVLYAQKCRVIHSIKGLFEINENVSLSCKPKTKGFRFYVFRLAIVFFFFFLSNWWSKTAFLLDLSQLKFCPTELRFWSQKKVHCVIVKIQKLHKSIISEWSLTFLKYVKRTNAKL